MLHPWSPWAQPASDAELRTAHPEVDPTTPVEPAGSLDRQSHEASRDLSKLFTAPLSASQSQKVLPAKDTLPPSLSRRDQGSQRQPKVEDAVGATLSRSWQENMEPYSSSKPHKLHIFRKTDRNWKLQLCLIGGEEQKENLAPRRNAERGNVSSAPEPLSGGFCCRWSSFHTPFWNILPWNSQILMTRFANVVAFLFGRSSYLTYQVLWLLRTTTVLFSGKTYRKPPARAPTDCNVSLFPQVSKGIAAPGRKQ